MALKEKDAKALYSLVEILEAQRTLVDTLSYKLKEQQLTNKDVADLINNYSIIIGKAEIVSKSGIVNATEYGAIQNTVDGMFTNKLSIHGNTLKALKLDIETIKDELVEEIINTTVVKNKRNINKVILTKMKSLGFEV